MKIEKYAYRLSSDSFIINSQYSAQIEDLKNQIEKLQLDRAKIQLWMFVNPVITGVIIPLIFLTSTFLIINNVFHPDWNNLELIIDYLNQLGVLLFSIIWYLIGIGSLVYQSHTLAVLKIESSLRDQFELEIKIQKLAMVEYEEELKLRYP